MLKRSKYFTHSVIPRVDHAWLIWLIDELSLELYFPLPVPKVPMLIPQKSKVTEKRKLSETKME